MTLHPCTSKVRHPVLVSFQHVPSCAQSFKQGRDEIKKEVVSVISAQFKAKSEEELSAIQLCYKI